MESSSTAEYRRRTSKESLPPPVLNAMGKRTEMEKNGIMKSTMTAKCEEKGFSVFISTYEWKIELRLGHGV